MARRLCQFLFTLVVLYVAVLAAFAWFHYEGDRPDTLTTAGEFHEWIASKFRGPPPPRMPPPDVPAPIVAGGPTSPTPEPPPPSADAPRSKAIAEVRDVLLPEAAAIIERMSAAGADVQTLRVDAAAVLVRARDLLGAQLDRKASDPEVQKLYKRVTDLRIAVEKR